MEINELTGLVINTCINIHKQIGPGCFEKVYEEILYYELCKLNLKVDRQLFMPVEWETLLIEDAYRLDLLVDDKLILEIKSVSVLPGVYFNQLKTYLALQNLKHGMLLNFKVSLMKDGIHRVFNNKGAESH